MWITVYDSQTMLADSYIMPDLSNIRRIGSQEPNIEWLHYKGPVRNSKTYKEKDRLIW